MDSTWNDEEPFFLDKAQICIRYLKVRFTPKNKPFSIESQRVRSYLKKTVKIGYSDYET